MKNTILTSLLTIIYLTANGQDWETVKANQSPSIHLSEEYNEATPQPFANLGWEDGLHISKDGLSLYCTYLPIDFLSFVLNGSLPNDYSSNYNRSAPTFGIDYTTNPIGANEWLHADILQATRASKEESFSSWTTSFLSRTFYSEGAPTPTINTSSGELDYFLFTSNDNQNNDMDIRWTNNSNDNLGTALPSPITSAYNEDNPHLERLDDQHLLLLFDSDNRPNGQGDIDIWLSESLDNGQNWSDPINLTSVNTSDKEHQPFLYQDQESKAWYLYFAAHHSDNKLAIFRSKQLEKDNWQDWGTKELLISAGSSAGVGEPTLTKDGDLSFVVVYENPNPSSIYDRYDADPWIATHANKILISPVSENKTSIYPNPCSQYFEVSSSSSINGIKVFDASGQLMINSENNKINTQSWAKGIYHIMVAHQSDITYSMLIVK